MSDPGPIRLPYAKLLVPKAAVRNDLSKRGNEVFDILASSRYRHTNVIGLVFWPQATLACYTPTYAFQSAHSLLVDGDPAGTPSGGTLSYPVPVRTGSPFPTVRWKRTAGGANAAAVLPDGDPAVCELKILDTGPRGSAWGFATADLGPWALGLGTTTAGAFDLNRGVAVTLRLGTDDTAGGALDGDASSASGTALPGDVRVAVGNLWSVFFPGDGGPPGFEKRIGSQNGGALWERLHTFAGATPALHGGDKWLVAFAAVAGRLLVSVGGRDLPNDAATLCYTEPDPVRGGLKYLTIPPAPCVVTGRGGGGPRWVGLRRVSWGGAAHLGQFSDLLPLTASLAAASDLDLNYAAYIPPIGSGRPAFVASLSGATTLAYTLTIPATLDGREPCAVKWVTATSARLAATPGGGSTVDWAGAMTSFTERIGEPDFSGAGGTRGSDGQLDLTFDMVGLDRIAAENATDWRADLAAYAPYTFILGNAVESPPGTVVEEETARIAGYLMKPRDSTAGFNDGTATRTGLDATVRLKNPAGFIDTGYRPLDVLDPGDATHISGADGVRYVLSRAIDPSVGASLAVFMPAGWPSLFNEQALVLNSGRMPGNDRPLWTPPYGKDAASWLKDIATFDYAALYPAGDHFVYGQFPNVIAGLPTWDVYDGADAEGHPTTSDLPNAQIRWVITATEEEFETDQDFNDWRVWGAPPGGVGGGDATALGAPLISAEATDFARAQASWQRTLLLPNPGRFYDQAAAQQLVSTVKTLSEGQKAARRYTVTLPFAKHEAFWGHKIHFHTPSVPHLDGKVLRVLRMTHKGDLLAPKVTCEMALIELLTGET